MLPSETLPTQVTAVGALTAVIMAARYTWVSGVGLLQPELGTAATQCMMRLQVATPRVRTAVKADIPHLDDHVSKLHAVGAQTQQKLQNVSEACEQAGVFGVQLPHNTVTTGGHLFPLILEPPPGLSGPVSGHFSGGT